MVLIESPVTLILFLIAFLIGALGPKIVKFNYILPYIGGLCTGLGIVSAFVAGASIQEILVIILAILLASTLAKRSWEGDEK